MRRADDRLDMLPRDAAPDLALNVVVTFEAVAHAVARRCTGGIPWDPAAAPRGPEGETKQPLLAPGLGGQCHSTRQARYSLSTIWTKTPPG